MSRMNLSEYVGYVAIFSCHVHDCVLLVVGLGLGLGLGLDLVSGWLVVIHTYLHYFRLSLSHSHLLQATHTHTHARTHARTHNFFSTYNSCYSESTALGSIGNLTVRH